MIEVKRATVEVDAVTAMSAVRVTKRMLNELEEKEPASVYCAYENYLTGRRDVLLELGLWTEETP